MNAYVHKKIHNLDPAKSLRDRLRQYHAALQYLRPMVALEERDELTRAICARLGL